MHRRYLVALLVLAACGSTGAKTAGGGYGTQQTTATTAAPTTATTAAATTATTSAYSYGGGGGGGGGYAVPPTSAPVTGGSQLTIIKTSLGSAVGDANGYALYVFTPDTNGTPTCTGSCANSWPPATTTGTPAAATGLDVTKLTTVKNAAGDMQVVYNGHPLYHYSGDAAPGDTNGQGKLGIWYLVSPAGDKITG